MIIIIIVIIIIINITIITKNVLIHLFHQASSCKPNKANAEVTVDAPENPRRCSNFQVDP